jgi:hypothetical protein
MSNQLFPLPTGDGVAVVVGTAVVAVGVAVVFSVVTVVVAVVFDAVVTFVVSASAGTHRRERTRRRLKPRRISCAGSMIFQKALQGKNLPKYSPKGEEGSAPQVQEKNQVFRSRMR